jgi:hypothetical protein
MLTVLLPGLDIRPSLLDAYEFHARETLTHMPDADLPDLVFTLACRVLTQHFGEEWAQRHLFGNSAPTRFFRNVEASQGDQDLWRTRIVDLAEMLINLRSIERISDVLEAMFNGDIEPRFAELDAARILTLAGAEFSFVRRSGVRGATMTSTWCPQPLPPGEYVLTSSAELKRRSRTKGAF